MEKIFKSCLLLYSIKIVLKDKENVEKYLEFIREKTKNVSKENVDEFENTLKELD